MSELSTTIPSRRAAPSLAHGLLLHRRCACGAHAPGGGECESCKKQKLQRRAGSSSEIPAIPPIVHDVLGASGQPLDAGARTFFEPRFGHDFSAVRVHADSRAAESAHAVNALAYTVGEHVVFAEGQYDATSAAGRELLAHELAHVTQYDGSHAQPDTVTAPGDASEREADRISESVLAGTPVPSVSGQGHASLQRQVGAATHCPANKNGASADPLADLKSADSRAEAIATNAATLTGADPPTADTLKIFEKRFGLPPAVKNGFLNRLSGATVASKDAAIKGELGIMSKRYALVARMFNQPVQYRCISGATIAASESFGGCLPPTCDGAFAWSCRGVGAIFLCPTTWNDAKSADEKGAVLVHEAFHMNFGLSNPGKQGEVGDATVKGPGRNFVVADCCSGFAADLSGVVNPADSCPAAP